MNDKKPKQEKNEDTQLTSKQKVKVKVENKLMGHSAK